VGGIPDAGTLGQRMKGRIFVTLFALPFFGIGAWMLVSTGSMFHDAWRMQGWEPVPAQLIEAGYETRSGDDSDTYKAYARYRTDRQQSEQRSQSNLLRTFHQQELKAQNQYQQQRTRSVQHSSTQTTP
jgi:hypothetical protein